MPNLPAILLLCIVGCSLAWRQHKPMPRLELAQVIFRNGQRDTYVYETYPGDRHVSFKGRGELTSQGEERVRELARALRRQYHQLLDRTVRVRSFDREACRESARVLIDELGLAETPVRSLPEDSDPLLNLRVCPVYRAELERVRRLPSVLHAEDRFGGLYDYLRGMIGLTFDEPTERELRAYQLYSVLEAQRSRNLSLPDWCTDGLYGLLSELAELHHDVESKSELLRRLNGGPLVRSFLDLLAQSDARGLRLAAVEEQQIAGLVRALDLPYPRLPDFASAIVLEKRRSSINDQILVRVMVWTQEAEVLFPVRLRGCATDFCPLGRFRELVGKVLPSDKELKCLGRACDDPRVCQSMDW